MNQTALTSRILALARPLLLLLLALTALRAMALGPEWWTTQNVLTVGTPADDYAAINQGQLKNLVSGAVAAMDTSWPDEGAGYDLLSLVQSWLTPTNQTDDYAAVTLGQLKAVSAPVYDRLISVGLATAYPWNTANTPAPDDYALANIGQAKALFAFDLNGTLTHHLPASWLARYPMSGTGTGPDEDFDGDGLTNFEEFLLGTDPTKADTDGDGFSDKDEQTSGSDPRSASSKPPEVTGDIVLQTRWVEVSIGKTFYLTETWDWEQTENGWSNVNLFTQWDEDTASETGTWTGSDGLEHYGTRAEALEALAVLDGQPWVENSTEVEIRGQANSGLTPVDSGFVGTETYRQSMPSTAPDGMTTGISSVHAEVTGGQDVIRVEEVRLYRKAPASTSVNILKPEASKTIVVSHEVNGIVGSVEAKTLSLAEGEDDGNVTQLLAPTLEAKKVKKDVASILQINVSGAEIGVIGDFVPSHKKDNPEKHFVTPKQHATDTANDDLNKPQLTLKLGTAMTAAEFDANYEWDISKDANGVAQGGMDVSNHLQAKINRDKPAHIVARVRKSGGGAEVAKLNVWVVWADGSRIAHEAPDPDDTYYSGTISSKQLFKFVIKPAEIITVDEKPDLSGANTYLGQTIDVPGSGMNHVTTGKDLKGGADSKWDMSRRMRIHVLNPQSFTKAQLPSAPLGTLFNAQPTTDDYPAIYLNDADKVTGNDDPYTTFQKNNPYERGQLNQSAIYASSWFEKGELGSADGPTFPMPKTTGKVGDTFEVRLQFGEFIRVLIGNKWYRCSDDLLWRVHYKFIKKSGFLDLTSYWADDNSDQALDNAGF